MKKNFVKKLALGLAMVMAVSTVNVPASAATKPFFKTASATVEEGKTVKAVIKKTKGWTVKKVVSNDETVATIEKVAQKAKKTNIKITGVKAGATVVKAVLKKGGKKVNLKLPVTVTAVAETDETGMTSVAQNTTTKLTAIFAEEVTAVKASDFSVVRNYDKAVVAIKSATIDSTDATKVIIETYTTMSDGKEYTVTYNADSTAQFTATDGVVADVTITPFVVTADKATKVYVQTLDDENIVVGTYTISTAANNNVEFSIETTEGYIDGDALYLAEVGNTAKAKVIYHTWEFDDNGTEVGKIEKEFTITAVKDATVISNYNFTISSSAPSWDSASFKANTTISANDTGMSAFFNIKDSNDTNVEALYAVASSDTSKLLIDEVALTNNTTGVNVVGVAPGTAYILLKNADGDTVRTFEVTVVADRKASVLTVDASAFTLSNGGLAGDVKAVKLTAKDQYGVQMSLATATATITVLSKPAGVGAVVNPTFTPAFDGTLTFIGTNYAKGTYVFKVEVTVPTSTGSSVVTRTITVNVQQPTGVVASYALVLTGVDASSTVDLAVKATDRTPTAKSVSFAVVTKDAAGVLNGPVVGTTPSYTVKYSDGTTVSTGSSIALTTVSGSAVSVASSAIKTGTYIVTAEFDTNGDGIDDKTVTKTFTVTDSQVAPTVVVKSTDANNQNIAAALAPSTNVVYYYDGTAYDGTTPGVSVVNVTDKAVNAAASTVYVQYVTIQFPVNGSVDRVITIPVNKTFTNVAP